VKMNSFLCLCFVAAVSANINPFSDIPECQRLHDSGYGVTGCSEELSDCFKDAHTKAQKCVLKEMSDPKVKICGSKPEIKQLRNDWFKLSCKWHAGVKKCMAGETTEGFSAASLFFRFKRNAGHADHQSKYQGKNPECWREVHTKSAECNALAANCEGYKICAGEEEAEDTRRTQWYELVNDLKQQKHEKMQSFKQKLSQCIRDEEAAQMDQQANEDEESDEEQN